MPADAASTLQMALATPLGDTLHFKSMSGFEEMSRLFEYQVLAVSDDSAVAPDDLLGTLVAVSIEAADDSPRWFHGVVASFGIEGVVGRLFSYRLTLRPWLWLLTRSANLRIYQDQTAPDIIKAVFGEYAGNFVDSRVKAFIETTHG